METFQQLAKHPKMQELLQPSKTPTQTQKASSQSLQSPRQSRSDHLQRRETFKEQRSNDAKGKNHVVEQPPASIGHRQHSTHGLVNGHDSNEQTMRQTIPMPMSNAGCFGGGSVFLAMIRPSPTLHGFMPDNASGAMQAGSNNPMYGNIGVQPGFQCAAGSYGLLGANMGMAGFSQPYVQNQNMTDTAGGNFNSAMSLLNAPAYDNLTPKGKPKHYKEGGQAVKFDTFHGTHDKLKALLLLQQFDAAFAGGNFTESSKIRKAATFLKFAPAWITNTFEVDVMTAWNLSAINCESLEEYNAKFWDAFLPVSSFKMVVIQDLESAHELIDKAISTALRESKPVYINVSCNLAGLPHPTFSREPVPYAISPRLSNCQSLEAAVEMAAEFLNIAVKPVLVGGPKLRVSKAEEAFRQVADASGYAVSVMPSAKGLFPETHSQFIGTYWGAVSSPFCLEIVESADAYIFAGPVFNDYSSVGYSLLFNKGKAVLVEPERVSIGSGPAFGCVLMKDFLSALSKKLKRNTTAHDNFKRIYVPPGVPIKGAPGDPLRVNVLFSHIQKMLTSNSAIIPETGDSWFNCQKLQLPDGCGYEFQMQYGSIGWSVGALLGYAQAMPERRVIGCIGDGSFQVTVQDVSTMIGQGQKNIIFLINNAGYTIEVEIHDGPYNIIKNWDYTAVVDAFHNKQGNCWTTKVKTEEELKKAIASAQGEKKDCLCFIECFVHKDDTSKELLEWGARVSAANSRPPNPQ
ncbi:hypothetical protein L7F22_054675 [Adiantum nelumboides]|nr:hypothetical protein [Adiantum nelumboides]